MPALGSFTCRLQSISGAVAKQSHQRYLHSWRLWLGKVQTSDASLSSLCGEGVKADVQSLMERAVVLGHGANKEEASPALAALVNQYAGLLAAQVGILLCLLYALCTASDHASSEHVCPRNREAIALPSCHSTWLEHVVALGLHLRQDALVVRSLRS